MTVPTFRPYRKQILARQVFEPTQVDTEVGRQLADAGDYICFDDGVIWVVERRAFEAAYEVMAPEASSAIAQYSVVRVEEVPAC